MTRSGARSPRGTTREMLSGRHSRNLHANRHNGEAPGALLYQRATGDDTPPPAPSPSGSRASEAKSRFRRENRCVVWGGTAESAAFRIAATGGLPVVRVLEWQLPDEKNPPRANLVGRACERIRSGRSERLCASTTSAKPFPPDSDLIRGTDAERAFKRKKSNAGEQVPLLPSRISHAQRITRASQRWKTFTLRRCDTSPRKLEVRFR